MTRAAGWRVCRPVAADSDKTPSSSLAQHAARILEQIPGREDALERGRLATSCIDLLGQGRRTLALARIDAIEELRETTTMTKRAIARELDVTENVAPGRHRATRTPRRVQRRPRTDVPTTGCIIMRDGPP